MRMQFALEALTVGVLMLGTLGCGTNPYAPQSETFRIVSIDSSGSFQQQLPWAISYAARLGSYLEPGRDKLRLLRFDREPCEIASEIPGGAMSFQESLQKEFSKLRIDRKHLATEKRDGTRPALLFQAIASELSRSSIDRGPVELFVMWDGGNDDRSPEMDSIYEASAKAICENPRVKCLVIWGVRNEHFEAIRDHFGSLGDRLRLYRADQELIP